jgi:hypothetical protein
MVRVLFYYFYNTEDTHSQTLRKITKATFSNITLALIMSNIVLILLQAVFV